jgi:3'-phosphoadenosine 5'-phosphosulfate sulfotransferase (PAPS reductase)/FAD synthetase
LKIELKNKIGVKLMIRKRHPPKHIIALSGGKDSTAMALRLKEINPHIKYEYVISPTKDELPEMKQHLARLETILGPFKIIGDIGLIELIKEQKMIPNFRARFCTRILKIEPFIAYMEKAPNKSLLYVGLRYDEPGRLGLQKNNIKVKYPLKDWVWNIDLVNWYLKRKNIKIPNRTDCGCCFFQRLPEWKNLLLKYPDRFEKYIQLEKEIGYTFRTPNKDAWPTSLSELKKEILSGRKMRKTKARLNKKCKFCTM